MSQNNDMHRIARALSKAEGSSDEYSTNTTDPSKPAKLAALTLIRRSIKISVAAVNANGSNVVVANANPSQHRAEANGRVLAAFFIPSVAATQHATNNASMTATITQANGVGAGRDVATANTNTVANGGTGTLAPGAPVALTVTDIANARFVKGEVLSASVTENSAGVPMGAGAVQYIYELEGPADDVGLT